MTEQCKTCEYRECKDEFLQCLAAGLAYQLTELKRGLPFVGAYVNKYECPHYLEEIKMGGES